MSEARPVRLVEDEIEDEGGVHEGEEEGGEYHDGIGGTKVGGSMEILVESELS